MNHLILTHNENMCHAWVINACQNQLEGKKVEEEETTRGTYLSHSFLSSWEITGQFLHIMTI